MYCKFSRVKHGKEFYRRGIFKLPERWEKCVQRSGDYVKNKESYVD